MSNFGLYFLWITFSSIFGIALNYVSPSLFRHPVEFNQHHKMQLHLAQEYWLVSSTTSILFAIQKPIHHKLFSNKRNLSVVKETDRRKNTTRTASCSAAIVNEEQFCYLYCSSYPCIFVCHKSYKILVVHCLSQFLAHL